MTAPTDSKSTRTRRSMLFPLDSDQVLPEGLPGIPDPIAEANERAHDARIRLAALQATANELGEKAKAAPRHDTLAASAAVDAGEPMPEATVEAKERRAADAKRNAQAAEQVAKVRTRELYDVVQANLDAYIASREQAYEAARAGAKEAMDTLIGLYPQLEVEAELLRSARAWHNNPNSAALRQTGKDPAAAFARQFDKELQRARSAPHSRAVPREPEALAAALAVELGVAE